MRKSYDQRIGELSEDKFNEFLKDLQAKKYKKIGEERNKLLKDLGLSEYYDYILSQTLGEKSEDEFNKIKMDLQALKEMGQTLKVREEKYRKIGEERNKVLMNLGWSECYDYIYDEQTLGKKSEDKFNNIKRDLQAIKRKEKNHFLL